MIILVERVESRKNYLFLKKLVKQNLTRVNTILKIKNAERPRTTYDILGKRSKYIFSYKIYCYKSC